MYYIFRTHFKVLKIIEITREVMYITQDFFSD